MKVSIDCISNTDCWVTPVFVVTKEYKTITIGICILCFGIGITFNYEE